MEHDNFGLNIAYNGKKNTLLCEGIAKDYEIGEIVCEYARVRPSKLRDVFKACPQKSDVLSASACDAMLSWIKKTLLDRYEPATALMITVEIGNAVTELFTATDDQRKEYLEWLNERQEDREIIDYILDDFPDKKFKCNTIGDVLACAYYSFALQYIPFKGSFDALIENYETDANKETNDANSSDEDIISAFTSLYSTDSFNCQHFRYQIVIVDGNFLSLYTIGNSISLLLFEAAHMIENNVLLGKCQNCGYHYARTGRSDSKYCTHTSPQNPNKTCRDIGAQITRIQKEKTDEATGLYRKIYMRNKMLQKRHPDDGKYTEILTKLVSGAKKWRKILRKNPERHEEYLAWVRKYDKRTVVKVDD